MTLITGLRYGVRQPSETKSIPRHKGGATTTFCAAFPTLAPSNFVGFAPEEWLGGTERHIAKAQVGCVLFQLLLDLLMFP